MSSDVFFLSCGPLRVPAFAFSKAPLRELLTYVPITNTVAVAVHASGDVTLVDVGYSSAACNDPAAILGRADAWVTGLRSGAVTSIADQLKAHGIGRDRVRRVIATHLHRDHVQGVCDFPNAELLVSERELAAFRTSRLGSLDERDLALHRSSGRLRPVTFAPEPFWGFDATFDVLGDGSVRIVDAAGHTSGTLGVALRRHDGWFLHIGDAAYRGWEYRENRRSLLGRVAAFDRKALQATHARIRAAESCADRPTVVPSHDAEVFRDLPQRPLSAF